jgi:hypothetical protein
MFLQIPDIVWTKLWHFCPFLAIAIILIIATVVVVRRIDKFLYKKIDPLEDRVKEHEKVIDKYNELSNCRVHTSDIDYTKKNIASIEKSLSYIMGALDSLKIPAKDGASPSVPLTQTRSPRQVTEPGHELLELCGAKQLFADKMDVFVSKLEEVEPKTALDVESQALKVLWALTDEDYFNRIKNYLYNNPKFKDGEVNLTTVCMLMSLELRNEYLKRHPEVIQNL